MFVRWMGKVRVIHSVKWFQLKKVVLKCFCLKGTTDFPSSSISSIWMLSAAAHNWKKQPFKMTLLRIWVSWFLTGSSTTSLVSWLTPFPVSEAPALPCLNVLQLLSHGPAQLPGSSPPARAWGPTTHTQHQRARLTRLLQPALLSGVATGVCSIPGALRPGRPWLKETTAIQEPPDSPPAPRAPAIGAAAASLPTES